MESTLNTNIVTAVESAVKALSGSKITLKDVLDYLRADIVDWYCMMVVTLLNTDVIGILLSRKIYLSTW